MNTAHLAAAAVAAAALLLATPHAIAADSRFQGLLRSRDLTPFGFLRLDMRPAPATVSRPDGWNFEAVLGYQNTWAPSANVERYLESQEPEGRRDLTALYAEIVALPGEKYVVDLESANLDLILDYRFAEHWTAYAIASFASYQGGFLDSFIEGFHRTFGLGNAGRLTTSRNQANQIYELNSVQYASFDSSTRSGSSDPTFGVRYAGPTPWEGWTFSIDGAVKIPIAGERSMLSTGNGDFGVQGSLQRYWQRDAMYLDFAAVFYDGAPGPLSQDTQLVPTLVIGYERVLGRRTSLVVQGYASRSVHPGSQTDLEELTGNKYLLTLGVRHRLNSVRLSFGITENLANFSNTPDISAQFGMVWSPEN